MAQKLYQHSSGEVYSEEDFELLEVQQQMDCIPLLFELGEVKYIDMENGYLQTWKCDEVGCVWHMDTEDISDYYDKE